MAKNDIIIGKRPAFLFDMDGVIVDSERVWSTYDQELLTDMLGADIVSKLPQVTGLSVSSIYEEAVKHGFTLSKSVYMARYNKVAEKVYTIAPITPGIEELIAYLQTSGYILGVVSSSPMEWISIVLQRVAFREVFSVVLSVDSHPELRPKPFPDGYVAAMNLLQVSPNDVLVLEDSNYGIQAAKLAGAKVIGFQGNLHNNYRQEGADMYAKSMSEVKDLIRSMAV